MSAFEYEAIDRNGRRARGLINADTARLARQELKGRNLVPLSLSPARSNRSTLRKPLLSISSPRMSGRDLALFTRQLHTMLDAGAPLEGSLRVLSQQADKPAVQRLISELRADVMEGYPFSQALARQGAAFSSFYRALVGAGESSGSLAIVLNRLALHIEKAQKIRSKVVTACVYPAALAVTALGVVAALIAFVVPRVVEQFDSMGQDLPALTTFVISLSDFTRSYGLAVVLLIGGSIAVGHYLMRKPPVRAVVDRVVLHVPFIGRLIRDLLAARLARTLSTLVSCGTPIVDGLQAARNTIQNAVINEAIIMVSKSVQEGASLSDALRATKVFPPLLVYMVAIGESSGRLETMLSKSADHLEDEFENVTATALSLLEPAIIIVMGAVVAVIVLAILLPILRLNSLALM